MLSDVCLKCRACPTRDFQHQRTWQQCVSCWPPPSTRQQRPCSQRTVQPPRRTFSLHTFPGAQAHMCQDIHYP